MANQDHATGLAGRYATAVFELAQEEKNVETLERDFATLKTAIQQSTDLARLVRAPVFTRQQQAKGMKAVLEKIGASPLTTRFVLTVASKRRLFALVDIIRAFEGLVSNQRGQVEAVVTSARALSDGETIALKAAIRSRIGREPRLEARVDPSLLGGLRVNVGSRMIDTSIRTKLNGIRLAMRGAS